MKQLKLPYWIVRAPRAVPFSRLDNIALVPASLLLSKGKYQTIANNLPKGGVLICQTENQQRIARILARVAIVELLTIPYVVPRPYGRGSLYARNFFITGRSSLIFAFPLICPLRADDD